MNLCLADDMKGMEGRHKEKADLIWAIADLLRHDWKQHEYGQVILPLTVLRRFDCALEATKDKVLEKAKELKGKPDGLVEKTLNKITGLPFHNTSKYTFQALLGDPDHIGANLRKYIDSFSKQAADAIRFFHFEKQLEKLEEKGLTFQVIKAFAGVDLHPNTVTDVEMGYIYEELNRKFAEISNETAGEHFTPREVICLMAHILFAPDNKALSQSGAIRTLYDPAMGTGGMLSVATDYLHRINNKATLETFGQEINDETYAIALSNMLMRGLSPDNVKRGNSFTEDGFQDRTFDYLLANPPFGVEWKKKYGGPIIEEAETNQHPNRFHAGLPGGTDAQMLFMQHMLSKFNPTSKGGSRMAIISNGSPLFTGDAGGGESEIRRWFFENDLVEAIIALPDQLYYNTGIYTYIWVFTNRKAKERKGKVQLIDAREMYGKMRKSLGEKRNEVRDEDILHIVGIYEEFKESKNSKVYPNNFFGYRRITIQRPLKLNWALTPERIEAIRDETAFQNLAISSKANPALKLDEENAGKAEQERIIKALRAIPRIPVVTDGNAFEARIREGLAKGGVKVSGGVFKAILEGLAERDESAPAITRTVKGKTVVESDSKLRDEERVPLDEANEAYFEREVVPFVPDAWIDSTKVDKKTGQVGIIGYEINFSRYFYEYTPARPLKDIDGDLRRLEKKIAALMEA